MVTAAEIKRLQRDITQEDKELSLAFRALSDPGRFRVFTLLMNQQNLCVGEVGQVLGVSTPAISQQLKVLEMSGLLQKDRDGKTVCYSLKSNDVVVSALVKLINSIN